MREQMAGDLSALLSIGHAAFYTLLYVEKGRIRVRLFDAAYEIEAGEAFLIPPDTYGERVGEWNLASGKYLLLHDAFSADECKVLYPDESGKRILKTACFDGAVDTEMLFRHLHAVLPKKGLAKRIRDYVKENLHTKLSLQTAAEDLGVSPVRLSAACKEALGCSFAAYVSRKRLDGAKHLLQNKTLKISDIAKKLGFSSKQYFSICFKKETGLSPSDYRKYIK
ncbi:MAG: helix-turn-helix domain-containing protein [Clostridia bacterium]|nr:helix-turn-helix domain-containing protein [Clostridia bacterium]